jgi:hypothetical protein
MNVWMKRGLQTALLTGGLLAVGSGIASADESIDVTVPVTITDNAVAVLGTSPGATAPEITLPAVDGVVRADLGPATVSVPVDIGGNSADAAGLDVAQPAAEPATQHAAEPTPNESDLPAVDVDAPITATGNAVAVLGEATAGGTAPAQGSDGGASVADVDAPVTVCGTGVGVLGDATTTCTTPSAPANGANGISDTDADTIADVDAPVTVCGTGVGVLGDATATCTTAGATDGGPSRAGQTDPVLPTMAGQQRDIAVLPARSDLLLSGALRAAGAAVTTAAAVTAGPAVSSGSALITGVTGLTGTAATSGASTGNTPGEGNGTRSTGALASTGADVALVVLSGLLALLVGLGLTIRARRRGAVLR